MSDTTTKGFFTDPDGDLSSGRLVKVLSFVMAAAISFAGFISIAFFHGTAELGSYCTALAAMFLGVATGTEIVQKLTGK